MKRAPTEAPIPMPAFSPVLRPVLGLAVRVGRLVGELWVEIVKAVGGMMEVELGVVGGVLVDEVDEYNKDEDNDDSNDEVEVGGTRITGGMSEDVGGKLEIREDVELAKGRVVKGSAVGGATASVLLELVLERVVLLLEVLLGSVEDDVVLDDNLTELDEEACCSELDILVVVGAIVEENVVEFEVTSNGITAAVLMEVTGVSAKELIPNGTVESPPTVEVIP
ncbi:hypothetical protein IFR05_001096 [Cadophora sp. M221]|nr:hypothetical protein IFR05_001096 [Cadophora sp. M221]